MTTPSPISQATISQEQAYWNSINEPITLKRYAGINNSIRIKTVLLGVMDPIIYFSDSNDIGGNYRHLRADEIASVPLTQEQREKRNLEYNPLLFERFADIGGPTTAPVCIPVMVNGTLKLVLSDGNCSTATLRKRANEIGDSRSQEWFFDIVDPATTELDKECLNLLHCGHQITEWPAYAQVAKIKQLISKGMKKDEAMNRIGLKEKEFKMYEATHDLHVEYLKLYPNEHGEKLHTKFSRLAEKEALYTSNNLVGNATPKENYFTAIHNGKVGDTNYVTGKKLEVILLDEGATSVLLNDGYEAALRFLGYEFNGTKWMPVKHKKSHKTADRYIGYLLDIPGIIGKLTSNDYPYLVEKEVELKAAIAAAQQAMQNSLSTVAVTAADIKRKAAAAAPKKTRSNRTPVTETLNTATMTVVN